MCFIGIILEEKEYYLSSIQTNLRGDVLPSQIKIIMKRTLVSYCTFHFRT